MGRPKGTNHQGRERLIEAAGRGFRSAGFGGAGVDGLAKQAGLTSGAFYAHFDSKAEVFRHSVVEGVRFLRLGVEGMRARHGDAWVGQFVDFYLGERMHVGIAEACAVPMLSADVARADSDTRKAYEAELCGVIEAMSAGLDGNEARAWALLSILSGAASIARAVSDETVRARVIEGAAESAKKV